MWDLLIEESARDLHRDAIRAVASGRTPPPLENLDRHRPRFGADDRVEPCPAARRRRDDRLRHRDRDRRHERRLLEKQLIEMQKMEAVGTLAGGIAHDFNNILTGILGSLDLARGFVPPGSPAAAPIAEGIKASERAVQLVRQLLDFSRRAPRSAAP